jgi:hypothetical protein
MWMTDRRPRSPAELSRPWRSLPSEARPALDLELVPDAGLPSLVASGSHAPRVERICDALAAPLHVERLVAPSAGHFVAAAPGFADRLEQFLVSVG